MAKALHSGRRKASALGKARAGRSAHAMNPEYLAEIERFRLMDDVMGKDLDLYDFDRVDKTTGLDLHDGTHIIYVNGATRSESDIGKLMHDFLCSNAAEMYFDILKRQVSQFKNSDEGRHAMCKAVEELVERGKRETMLAMAKRMLKSGMLALKDIARFSGLSLAQVEGTTGVDGVRTRVGVSGVSCKYEGSWKGLMVIVK